MKSDLPQFLGHLLPEHAAGRDTMASTAVCLLNDPVNPPAPQVLHSDTDPTSPHSSYAVMLGFKPFSILVAPGTHRTLDMAFAFDEAGISAWHAPMPVSKGLIVLHMQPGQALIFNGKLVHAGAAGEEGQMAPRLHWYAQDVAADAEATFPMSSKGVRLRFNEEVSAMVNMSLGACNAARNRLWGDHMRRYPDEQ
jgi:hypothetical protein